MLPLSVFRAAHFDNDNQNVIISTVLQNSQITQQEDGSKKEKTMYIQLKDVEKNYGTSPIFSQVSFAVNAGDKIGLVGMNGCGKSTLFQILTGEEGVNSGIVARKKGLHIGYVPQQLPVSNETVRNYLLDSFIELKSLRENMHLIEAKMQDPQADFERVLAHYGRLQEDYEKAGGYTLEDRISGTLKGLGVGDKLDSRLDALSGGQRVRIELARVLTVKSDLLLLDEPTNHLDLAGIQWLESWLAHTQQAYVVISHDRQFLDNVVTQIVEIEPDGLATYPGNYTKYANLKKERIKALQKDYDLQQKEIHRLQLMIRRYRQWANEGDNEDFFRKVKELERRVEKLKSSVTKPPQTPKKRLQEVSHANRSGKEVLIAEKIGKLAGEQLLFADSSFTIYRQEKIALTGANGSGKSTLIHCLLGKSPLDDGGIRVGASVKIGYLPQKFHFAHPQQRILEKVKEQLPDEQKARHKLAQFGFYAEDVSKRIQDLSGGEQMRLYLLGLLQEKINFLILDEPTNHLDIFGKEELEDILENYQETLLVVSHDRYFLQKVASMTLAIENQQITKKIKEKDACK